LKGRFTKKPVLAILDLEKMRMKVVVFDYVFDYVTEEVLSIECKDGRWRPIAFLSKSLDETEKL